MTNTLAHPLVRSFLSSVEDRTAALPDARRRELLADLREHIEVALSESDPSDGSAVRRILDQLGTPTEIADAALSEEPAARPVPESPRRTAITLGLLVLPLPAALIPVLGLLVAPAAAAAGLIRLWKSPQWSRGEKRQATLFALSPLLTVPALAAALSTTLGGLSPVGLLAALLLAAALPTLAAIRLHRTA
ncbi:HAAS signaling domain-containing protein [Kitasatospora sp. NPDC048239]|uniref:HAAS signaling domain-containing protein n=1 Tax=Kitasatospora sp. NPDC048239 TaxID=3364046 RepID=UPI003712C4D1